MRVKATIIMPSYNEEKYISAAIESLLSQLPDDGSIEMIVADSSSTDQTVNIARRYSVFVANVDRGKLTARVQATAMTKAPIIVAVDSDTVYPAGWLNRILNHFDDPEVVGVSGWRAYQDAKWLNGYAEITSLINFVRPHMCGGNSAYLRAAFYAIGGFQAINQTDRKTITREEEYAFAERLKTIGKVVFDESLVCYTTARHFFPVLDMIHWNERETGVRF